MKTCPTCFQRENEREKTIDECIAAVEKEPMTGLDDGWEQITRKYILETLQSLKAPKH